MHFNQIMNYKSCLALKYTHARSSGRYILCTQVQVSKASLAPFLEEDAKNWRNCRGLRVMGLLREGWESMANLVIFILYGKSKEVKALFEDYF